MEMNIAPKVSPTGSGTKRPRYTKPERWASIIEKNRCIDETLWGEFSVGSTVTCKACNTKISLLSNWKNLDAHLRSGTHVTAMIAFEACGGAGGGGGGGRGDHGEGAADDATEAGDYVPQPSENQAKTDARAALVLRATTFMSKKAIQKAYSADMLAIANAVADGAFTATTINRAYTRGAEMLDAAIAAKLKGNFFSLLVDEANTKMVGRDRPLAIVLGSSAIGTPICINVVFGEDKHPDDPRRW